MDPSCHGGYCAKCWGGMYVVIGFIVLITAMYWQKYIWHVLAVLLILKGIMKMGMPYCPDCKPSEMKKGKK